MIEIYKPSLDDLWFKQSILSDEETMSYNHAWGGTLPFPKEKWSRWYSTWLEGPESQRYYRYLYETELRAFVGEIAYRYDEQMGLYLCDVIILAKYRKRGFGSKGIQLICQAAKDHGITTLYDNIAADNPSRFLFEKCGFEVVRQDQNEVLVKKELSTKCQ